MVSGSHRIAARTGWKRPSLLNNCDMNPVVMKKALLRILPPARRHGLVTAGGANVATFVYDAGGFWPKPSPCVFC